MCSTDQWKTQCKCGHSAPMESFWSTPINGELPKGHYQCPECKTHWVIKATPVQQRGNKIVELPQVL